MEYSSAQIADILSLGLNTDAEVVTAVDTEYAGTHTLTVQAAARLDQDTLAVQLYKSPSVPDLPGGFSLDKYLPAEKHGKFFKDVVVRTVKHLSPDLSPMRMIADLFGLADLDILTRAEGRRLIDGFRDLGDGHLPANVSRRRGRLKVPAVKLTVVGHHLNADFARIHGRDFLAGLGLDRGDIVLRCRKVVQFADPRRRGDPVLEFCRTANGLHEVRVRTRDTLRPFGPASLDGLAKTFLGTGKADSVSEADKADMEKVFRERTADACGYAMADAVLTLLVYERMQERDRGIYRSFGFAEADIPPMRGTLGSRVSSFLVEATRRSLGECGSLPSRRALEGLMRQGGMDLFRRRPEASRYGDQTGKVHGGLLHGRSPTRLWHASPGMLRDVDMASCYQSVVSRMNVYWGRPLVLEAGGGRMSLKEAVDLASRAAPPDGWFVRASGRIEGVPNALLPSTDNAVTSANYRSAMRHGRGARRQGRRDAFHLESLRDPGSVRGTGGSRLYASVVESAVVTRQTWLMIQALPSAARERYERLEADSVVFHPAKLVAGDGVEFDELAEKYRHEGLPWDQTLDLDAMELVTRERIDAEYVSLRFPIGEHARRIGEFRCQAREAEGRGSGGELAWKVHA